MKYVILLFWLSFSAHAALKTEHETNGFKSYTTLPSMHSYVEQLQRDNSDVMAWKSFGKTHEGRVLKYAILSKPLVSSYEQALALNKTIVVLGFNIHGDERTLRESMLIYLRELVKSPFLKDLAVIVVPTLNPDGFVKAKRKNALHADMNRDYIKLEHKATKSFVSNILKKWRPHVWVDGHNGGARNYDILYLSATHPDTPQYIRKFSEQKLFPSLTETLKQKGYRSFYYARPTKDHWKIGMHHSRIGRNYGGLTNIITILLEAPNGKAKKKCAIVGVETLKAIVKYIKINKKEIVKLVKRSRKDALALHQKRVTLKGTYRLGTQNVSYWRVPKKDSHGKLIPKALRKEVFVKDGKIRNIPYKLKARDIPYGYLVPKKLTDVIKAIKLHRLEFKDLGVEKNIKTQSHILGTTKKKKLYNHKQAVFASVKSTLNKQIDNYGDYIYVPTAQQYGRICPLLFEPDSEDSLLLWNKMDSYAKEQTQFPILRVMEPLN